MDNTLIIAKKEFTDIISSNAFLVVLVIYVAYILLGINSFNSYLEYLKTGLVLHVNVFQLSLTNVFHGITLYGSFVAMILGFFSIASEKYSNALNLLITKPVYRDTIINGKMIAVLAFLLVMNSLAILLYVSGVFIIAGNVIMQNIPQFLLMVILILVLSTFFSMIFVSLSILISVLTKNFSMALTIGMFILVIFQLIQTVYVSQNLSLVLGSLFNLDAYSISYFISSISPYGAVALTSGMFDPSLNFNGIINGYGTNILMLVVEAIILTIFSYIAFLRADIR